MSELKFNCPHCNQPLEAPQEMFGKTNECPSCSGQIQIPYPTPNPTPGVSPPPKRQSAPLKAPPPPKTKPSQNIRGNYDPAAKPKQESTPKTKPCPFCGEEVFETAKKCKHCKEMLDDELRAKHEEKLRQKINNPFKQITALVAWITGLDRLQGFSLKQLFSQAFKHRSEEEIEAYFDCSEQSALPLSDVSSQWPRPWFFWRFLIFGLLVLLAFQYMFNKDFTAGLPGIMIVGAFVVPLSCCLLFFEYNVLRNISLYYLIKCIVYGGVVSLLTSVNLFIFTDLHNTFLGAMSAGIVEETGKLFAVMLLLRNQPNKRWVLNGMVVGAAVGVGFAGFETAGYIFIYLHQGGLDEFYDVLMLRAVLAPFGHVVWTASVAGALLYAQNRDSFIMDHLFCWKFLRIFIFVMFLHMFWNSDILWDAYGVNILYAWGLSLVGSWHLAFLLLQKGLQQIREAQEFDDTESVTTTEKAS